MGKLWDVKSDRAISVYRGGGAELASYQKLSSQLTALQSHESDNQTITNALMLKGDV